MDENEDDDDREGRDKTMSEEERQNGQLQNALGLSGDAESGGGNRLSSIYGPLGGGKLEGIQEESFNEEDEDAGSGDGDSGYE